MASTSIAFDVIARDLASSKLHQIGNAADRTSGPLGRMGSKLKGLAVAAGVAAAAGVVFAAKWGVEAVNAAAADAEAQTLLAGQIRRSTDARKADIAGVEDWVAAQGEALGVTDDELRPALSRLVTATKDVGAAQDLASLAMDVAASRGKSLQSVSEALGRAADGNTTALSRLGIKTKDASGETLSFREMVKTLTDQFAGAASEKADTYAGKMDRLKVKYDETKEAIGARLLPKLTELADWLLDEGIPRAEELGDTLNENVAPAMRDLADATSDFISDAKPLTDLFASSGDAAEDASVGWLTFQQIILTTKVQLKVLGKGFGAAGQALGDFLQIGKVTFAGLSYGIADLLSGWANMLDALGEVPGFGWADKAADKMDAAAARARELGDDIKGIPDRKDITIAYHYQGSGQGGLGSGEVPLGSGGGRPGGAQPRQSGRTVNGQQGRMMSGGTDAMSIAQALRTVLDGARLQIVPGTSDQFYLLTGTGL